MRSSLSLGWLLCFVAFLAHIYCEDVFGIVGENFTFPVKIDQKIMEIIWTKNKDKVAEWEEQTKPTYFNSLCYRGLLNEENGCLTIFNLENNDTGTYMLDYVDSMKKSYVLTFILAVLAPPSEPEIRCNISGDNLVLVCISDFQKTLHYTWNFSRLPATHHTQEVVISKKDVDASERAACFIRFSQTEKSSEISLTQCFSGREGRRKCLTGRVAWNSPVHGSDISGKENSSLLAKHADDNGINEGEVTQDAEGGNGEQLSNPPCCSTEAMEEKR
ncbi:lymphocyte function-associated antigen 3 isoform X9 [Falco biarmicus]|uniref:lymphocyte function-associated antigen 3 isoform X9 n=1 Tax=Falco cherrug TaxID=345164 RepID=UPI000FFC1735|nr:lymphocyte function-associated antigen 3 isoform X9 [Falco cherrug]XP_037246110.1 lymphocyte function-associated antigen 3 isoform X7 [Falco rusticolus]XP_056196766.1 lymphocyte function-associated antigen 3 isoform X9 [Falco biarmicus]